MAKIRDAFKVASLLLDLSRMWAVVNKANPITPKRITDTLKRIQQFFTGALLLAVLLGSGVIAQSYHHVPDNRLRSLTSEEMAESEPRLRDPRLEPVTPQGTEPTQVGFEPLPVIVKTQYSVLVPHQVLPALVPPIAPPQHSVLAGSPADYDVLVRVDEGATWSRGSGTLYRPDAIVTCYHLFTDSKKGIQVTFPDGKTVKGKLIDCDTAYDIACVQISPVSYTPAPLSQSKNLKRGFTAGGYGKPTQPFRRVKGPFVQWVSPREKGTAPSSIVIDAAVRPGDSGGGIFNDGELYGVLWGCVKDQTYGTSGAGFRQFIKRFNSRLDAPVSKSQSAPQAEQQTANRLEVYSDPDICLPCARLSPILDSLAKQGYNVHEHKPTADQTFMPLLVYLNDDNVVERVKGWPEGADENTIKAKLRK